MRIILIEPKYSSFLVLNGENAKIYIHWMRGISGLLLFAFSSKINIAITRNVSITKIRLYNFDPLEPHFYIVKLELTGVYIIFSYFCSKHRLWVLVRTASLKSTRNLYFEQKYEKYQSFLPENFHFLEVKFSIYLNRRVFVMLRELLMSRNINVF